MNVNTKELIDALKVEVVTIVFEKIDTGELRTMPCTLNNDVEDQKLVVHSYSSPDTILCFNSFAVAYLRSKQQKRLKSTAINM